MDLEDSKKRLSAQMQKHSDEKTKGPSRGSVNLQVSSDLKTWEDVQPGQYLGSDSARFFRIKTSEQ